MEGIPTSLLTAGNPPQGVAGQRREKERSGVAVPRSAHDLRGFFRALMSLSIWQSGSK
jgi:hypothetical protein